MKSVCQAILVALLFSVPCNAADSYRLWHAANGSSIKARVLSVTGDSVLLETEDHKQMTLQASQLSKTDQDWLTKYRRTGEAAYTEQDASNTNPDRFLVPTFDQNEFAKGSTSCGPNAFANFVLWWDRVHVYEIPKGKTEIEKAEWLHKELCRYFTTQSGGTSWVEMEAGIRAFFKDHPSKEYDFNVEKVYPLNRDVLYQKTQGLCATMLSVSTCRKDNHVDEKKGHWVSLLMVTANGGFLLNTWGRVFRGQFIMTSRDQQRGDPGVTERIDLDLAPDSNVDYLKSSNLHWTLDPKEGNMLVVVTPKKR